MNKIDKRCLRAYITPQLFKVGKIAMEFGNDSLRRDKLTIDNVISGKVKVESVGTPS